MSVARRMATCNESRQYKTAAITSARLSAMARHSPFQTPGKHHDSDSHEHSQSMQDEHLYTEVGEAQLSSTG